MKSLIYKLALLAGVILTTSAWGQAVVTVGTGEALPGVTGITIPVNLTAGQDISGIQMKVLFTTPANYTNIAVNCFVQTVTPSPSPSCLVINGEVRITIGDQLSTAWVDGLLANITFDVPANATPTLNDPLVALVEAASDTNAMDLDPLPLGVDGAFTVLAGPQPVFGSAPTAATGVSISGEISTTIQTNVIIQNNAGEDGSTLTYTCTETSDPDDKFSITGDMTDIDVSKGSDATLTVACDSSEVGVGYAGEMSCEHNGSNASPAVFPLSCTVNAGPEPAYTGTPTGLAMVAAEEGDANPTGSLAITNTGNPTTVLNGTCSLSGDAEISMTGSNFSVAQGASAAVFPVACDASTEGFYNATLSCTHNGTNVATPVAYPVSCEVGPPGAAVYSSTPAPGSTIDMTPTPVPSGTPVGDQVLTITNAAPEANDSDLLLKCGYIGDEEISATSPNSPLAPMDSTQVTFSCDSTDVGDYTGTYSCSYSSGQIPDGDAAQGLAPAPSYTVDCSVRAAESELGSTPAPGSTLNITVPAFGTGYTFVNISEINDEGLDATIESCSLADGANFSIVTGGFPITIPAGTTVQIQIEGTDPGNGNLNFTDTLTCEGTDSQGTNSVEWFLNMNVQTAAIPTLSTLGLLALILTMFGFGGIMIRRKIGS